MAFQTLASTSTSPAATSSSSASGNNDTPVSAVTSSLPFTFLITFVVIFVLMLTCGVGSRRIANEIRRNLGWGPPPEEGLEKLEPPALWDVYLDESKGSEVGKGKGKLEQGSRAVAWTNLLVSACPLSIRISILTTPSPRSRSQPPVSAKLRSRCQLKLRRNQQR